jgi:hypothetical protein
VGGREAAMRDERRTRDLLGVREFSVPRGSWCLSCSRQCGVVLVLPTLLIYLPFNR